MLPKSPWHTLFIYMPTSSYCKCLGFSAWRLYLATGAPMHIGWAEMLQASTNDGQKLVNKYYSFLAPWEGQTKYVPHTVSHSSLTVHTSYLLFYVIYIQFLPFPVLLTTPLECFLGLPPKQTTCIWNPCLRDNRGKSTMPRLFCIFEDECSARSLDQKLSAVEKISQTS